MSIYMAAAMALYYLSEIAYFSKDMNINSKSGNPWPPTKRIIKNISIKIIYIIKKIFRRKTCKTIIHPERYKGWKGER